MTITQEFRPLSLKSAPARSLPERPHLDHLRSEAKRRLATMKAVSQAARLSDAQFLVAREYGFTNWMALKTEVDRRRQLCGTLDSMMPAVVAHPLRTRRRDRIAALATPETVEQTLFPTAAIGFALTQLLQIGGPLGALMHLLLR
jgi:hypothetical protein